MASTAACSVFIERPVEVVFAYLADVRRHHEWNTDLLRTEVLDDGPIGVGTHAVEVRKMFGREVRSPFVIVRHEPPERQEFHTTDGPMRPDGVLRCVEEAGGTRASYEMTLQGPTAPLQALMIRRGMPKNLANVKRLLDSHEAP